jgi:hypothetical protein
MKTLHPLLLLLVFIGLAGSSCTRKKGCMDTKALSYNSDAKKDNGSCTYSKVTFYAKYGYYNTIPITQVTINVKGNTLGNLSAVYPNGPGNCSAPGTLVYQFQDGQPADWNSTVKLANGATLFGSGTISPNRYEECIKVNVTQ